MTASPLFRRHSIRFVNAANPAETIAEIPAHLVWTHLQLSEVGTDAVLVEVGVDEDGNLHQVTVQKQLVWHTNYRTHMTTLDQRIVVLDEQPTLERELAVMNQVLRIVTALPPAEGERVISWLSAHVPARHQQPRSMTTMTDHYDSETPHTAPEWERDVTEKRFWHAAAVEMETLVGYLCATAFKPDNYQIVFREESHPEDDVAVLVRDPNDPTVWREASFGFDSDIAKLAALIRSTRTDQTPDTAVDTSSAEADIDRLAKFIEHCIPGEPSTSEGVVDTVIRLLAQHTREAG